MPGFTIGPHPWQVIVFHPPEADLDFSKYGGSADGTSPDHQSLCTSDFQAVLGACRIDDVSVRHNRGLDSIDN